MAWRIADQVERGEIDNRTKDLITGILWLRGWAQPVRLQLTGNAGPDMAGRLVRFTNPKPTWVEPDQVRALAALQNGVCGDMIAHRDVRVPLESQNAVPCTAGMPTRVAQAIYLEWFSDSNGRVVIEGVDFEVSFSEPAWLLSVDDVHAQKARNVTAWSRFMEDLTEVISRPPGAAPTPAPAEKPEASDETEPNKAIERRLRINELKHEAEKLAGGHLVSGQMQPMPPELEEMFWRNVVAFEKAPTMSRRELLERDGIELRAVGEIDPSNLTSELWKLIHALARRQIFLVFTDHLSERELYELLLDSVLPEISNVPPENSGWQCQIDLTEYGSRGDGDQTYLRYYADEETRERWAANFPELSIPAKEKPKYHRDHRLPQPEPGHSGETWTMQ